MCASTFDCFTAGAIVCCTELGTQSQSRGDIVCCTELGTQSQSRGDIVCCTELGTQSQSRGDIVCFTELGTQSQSRGDIVCFTELGAQSQSRGDIVCFTELGARLSPVANLIVSFVIRRPTAVIGGARSQSPACDAVAARSLALSRGPLALSSNSVEFFFVTLLLLL